MELFALASLVLVAGLISFTAPCTLPSLPGYVASVSGMSDRPDERPDRRRPLAGVGLFALGFTAVWRARRARTPPG